MTYLLPVSWKLYSNRCYLVPFFDPSLRILVLISTGVRRPGLSVGLAFRSVLGIFCGCILARIGCDGNSRRADTGGEPRGKRLSSQRDQCCGALFPAILTLRSGVDPQAFRRQ